MTAMDPRLFGRYEIRQKLAGGGMGRVYLAYDPVLNREVGLKLIDSGGDRDSIDMIAAERRGAMLQDQLAKREPSGRVAQIFDVGERDGYFFIAMEYIEGEDLSEIIARGPLEPEQAVGIALDVLDVLVKAHAFQSFIEDRPHRGIIHGDIKPRNIRITPSGQVKVLDFGIAKAISMTKSITFNQFGSIPYSSPERLQTGDMDARSDVWSVAVVLFEMLTGRPYFEAQQSSRLEWIIRNYKALQPEIATLAPGLRGILSHALDPDPNRRFASAAAFQSALYEWKRYAASEASASRDPDATRRTAYADDAEKTRRRALPTPSPNNDAPPRRTARPMISVPKISTMARQTVRKALLRSGIALLTALLMLTVFSFVYTIRMARNSEELSRDIDSGRMSSEGAKQAYDSLAGKSLFAWPLHAARNSLRARLEAEADRVIADYREASESTPVTLRDWRRAQSTVTSALAIEPGDKTLTGKHSLIDGYINLRTGDLKTARAEFEGAEGYLPHSPDPHLGLALIHMSEGDLDKAEKELQAARRNGFTPGRREQRALADGYRTRGEKWLSSAHRAHDLSQMQDSLRHADGDLAHAQELYNSIAPFLRGVELAERVSEERDRAAKLLDQAAQIPAAGETP